MNATIPIETRPDFATDLLPRFRAILELPETQHARESIESQLRVQPSPGLVRHQLVQFRLYPEGLQVAAVYFSVLSSGFLRTEAIPFPLRQIGVKVDAVALDAPVPSEVYIEPVAVADARAWLQNGGTIPATPDTIGYGIVLGNAPIAVEHYHWFDSPGSRIELRTNLLTGRIDRYHRHRLNADARALPRTEEMSLWDHARLVHMIESLAAADGREEIDPVIIYSKKPDSSDTLHVAVYLTTATKFPVTEAT